MEQEKKTIAIVVNAAWNIINYREDLISLLLANGFNVEIYVPTGDDDSKLIDPRCQIIELKCLSRKGKNPLIDLFFTFELFFRFLRSRSFLVLLYTPKPNIYGSLAAAWANKKSIATITGLGYTFTSKTIAGGIIKKLYKLSLKKTSLVVFQNSDDHGLFVEQKWVRKDKTSIINGSGVNTEYFFPQNIQHSDDRVEFLFIGRLLKDKGLDELIGAFDQISENYKKSKLVIVGRIDNNNPGTYTQSEVDAWLHGNTRIILVKGSDDVRPFIAAADVVVLPSYREGMPKTILEAMAMAKPIIVTDVPGCRETIKNGEKTNGLLCNNKDVESLSAQMEKMILLSVAQRMTMGRMSRKMAEEKFDQKIINQQYLSLIRQLK